MKVLHRNGGRAPPRPSDRLSGGAIICDVIDALHAIAEAVAIVNVPRSPAMTFIQPSRPLQIVLAIDAVASGALGLLQTFAAPLAQLLALPGALLFGSGVFLIAYAAVLVAMARSVALPQALVRVVMLGNLAWAIGCVALAALASGIAPLGVAYLGVQAVAVVAFAAMQGHGLQRSQPVRSMVPQRA